MKVLFIVQGEGRGHLTQAITLEEILRRNGHEVVEVLVGKSNNRRLPGFFNRSIQAPVKRFLSPNFLPTPANKRVSLSRSIIYNLMQLPVYFRSVCYIRRRIRESEADLVINFYELLTGLTYFLFRPSVPQISVGHQYLFLHRDFDFPDKDSFSLLMLRFFTRLTCIGAKEKLALSFRPMEEDNDAHISVIPPLLRREVLCCEPTDGDYVHGYMVNTGFGDSIVQWHKQHPEIPMHFFWDKPDEEDVYQPDDTLSFHQLDDEKFLRYMAGCRAYATTAGFESVCEAMLLKKPLLMVPVHIEQDCNAYDASRNGAGIVSDVFDVDRLLDFAQKDYQPEDDFRRWVRSCERKILNSIEAVEGIGLVNDYRLAYE
ncbi:glycosyltransferase family protein [Bacteroides sp. UBA939]|uniref:glycosyltransferase family protein n=1 Tax=Bacteroides sp. UBA939 TaxID=1946092 RepID=UPI0025C1E52E|nr:glycosyltransferase family protein [Bacteroides sp. UBA939]